MMTKKDKSLDITYPYNICTKLQKYQKQSELNVMYCFDVVDF